MDANPEWQGNRIKIAVILNGVSARAQAAGRRAVKNPVKCLNGVRSGLTFPNSRDPSTPRRPAFALAALDSG